MSKTWSTLASGYRNALRDYLAREEEGHLQRAYEIGRLALNRSLGILDMSRMHQEALAKLGSDVTAERITAIETFFLEALSPFEAAHRGFREAVLRLEELNRTSARRNRELATINARLKSEIEEREKTRQELAKRERQLAEAQRLAGLGSFEWDLETGALHWSDELYRIYGIDPKRCKPSLGNYLVRVHPEDRLRVRRAIQTSIRNCGSYSFDERIVHAGGEVRVLHSQGEVIPAGEGRNGSLRLVGFCQDITERRQAEEMWTRYETIVNTARDFLTLVDRRYRHEAVNDAYCQAHGMPREKIIGRAIAELWGRTPFCAILKRHLDDCFSGRDVHYQCWFEFGSLGRRYYDINHYPYLHNGAVTHAIVVTRDITDQKQAQDALQESKEHYVQLFREAQEMEENLRQLSHKVVTAQEEERKHISRELHDEVGQTLTAVNVSIAMLKKEAGADGRLNGKVAAAQKLLEQSLETVHRFARELRPEMLDHLGPYAALRSYAKSFGERTGIKTVLQPNVTLDGIDGQQAIVLFRIAQESLTNVFKHARATRVDIRFPRIPGGICMEIADDGRSFHVDAQLAGKGRRRLGLLGMQERVRLVNGTFSIESVPGRGTTVRVQIPVGSEQKFTAEKRPRDSTPVASRQPRKPKSHEEDKRAPGRRSYRGSARPALAADG
jgi:PAS domain S-box-containing protein